MRLEPAAPPEVLEAIHQALLERPAHVLDAPVVQPLGLLLDLAGETLRERLFIVQGGEGGAEACLRPDFTVPALQAHLASGRASGRYIYAGHAFRVAPPGSSRAEEFPQFGLEVFELGDIALADAEIAALAWRAALAGGRQDLTLLLGDVGLFAAVVEAFELAPPLARRLVRAFSSPRRLQAELTRAIEDGDETAAPRGGALGRQSVLARLLADLPEPEAATLLQDIWALAGVEPVGGRSAADIVQRLAERATLAETPRLTDSQARLIRAFLGLSGDPETVLDQVMGLTGYASKALVGHRERWSRRLTALQSAGVPRRSLRFSAAFGRTFGYYDGMVFEVRSGALGEDQPVAAGGRYDGLPVRLGAKLHTGAVGCMVRPGRAWVGGRR